MRLKIKHISTYSYEKEIFLEPHHLYFHPQLRPYFNVLDFKQSIFPVPAGQSLRIDGENNNYTQCWFNDLVKELKVEVNMVIEATAFNQFNYLLEGTTKTYFQEVLEVYSRSQTALSPEIVAFIATLDSADATSYLGALCESIHNYCSHITSEEDELMPPNECFREKKGSCRDLAWLMMEMLRFKSIPARFVSGYSYNPEIVGHELHAWVEAWQPGAGWIALDPSSGLFTTESYIPLACSYHPTNTLPIQGLYRGKSGSQLETQVYIDLEE
jgi:transglutaminase-like putative cysteine protease